MEAHDSRASAQTIRICRSSSFSPCNKGPLSNNTLLPSGALTMSWNPCRPRRSRAMKTFCSNTWAALGLLICLLTSDAKAQSYYWDIDGATPGAGGATPSGLWEDVNWTTDSTGSSATINLPESVFPRFAAGSDATGNYTVTANSDHTILGMLHNSNPGTVTITGPGVLTIGGGVQQGFFGGTGGFIRIQSKLTGTGGVISQTGQIYLDGD